MSPSTGEASTLQVRLATVEDAEALGRMGSALARQHHAFDAARFMLPEGVEAGYHAWLSRELGNASAVVLVAVLQGRVVGYCYGRVEGRDWNKLLDRYGELIDLWVDDGARRSGAGTRLAQEMFSRLCALGVPRVVLMSASKNESAQRLFASMGFRPTMVELTREGPPPAPSATRHPGQSSG